MRRTRVAAGLVFGLIVGVGVALFAAEKAEHPSALFKQYCAKCHGEDGKAETDQGKKMAMRDISTAAWQAEFTDEKIKAAINDGVKTEKDGKKKTMDPYKDKLPAEQISALVGYIRTLKK